MKITRDKKLTLYIRLSDNKPYHTTRKITENVLVDYTEDGSVIGIEVLAASENVPLPAQIQPIPVEQV